MAPRPLLRVAGSLSVAIGCGHDSAPSAPTTVTPTTSSLKSIAVSLSNTSIAIAMNSQATATLKDSLEHVVTDRTATWTSANPDSR